jgi:hypothetical protein
MTSLLLSERAPPYWGLHLWWTGGELLQRMPRRGTAWEIAPPPNQDPALSAKETTGGLSAPISRWKVKSHLLWIDGSWPPVHAPLLVINVEEPRGSHNGRKAKGHFPTRQWSLFILPFSPGPQSNDKVIVWGLSGQPLE